MSKLTTKIILDTNFFISIALGSKYLNRLWELLSVQKALNYKLIISDAIFNEVKAKLYGDKIRQDLTAYSETEMSNILKKILTTHTLINPTTKLNPIQDLSDLQDMLLFELAEQEKADFILSNDKQVLKQHPFGVTKILSFKEFMDKFINIPE
jgi:putative PIN family toxin of toxin-antitoxin system